MQANINAAGGMEFAVRPDILTPLKNPFYKQLICIVEITVSLLCVKAKEVKYERLSHKCTVLSPASGGLNS